MWLPKLCSFDQELFVDDEDEVDQSKLGTPWALIHKDDLTPRIKNTFDVANGVKRETESTELVLFVPYVAIT